MLIREDHLGYRHLHEFRGNCAGRERVILILFFFGLAYQHWTFDSCLGELNVPTGISNTEHAESRFRF